MTSEYMFELSGLDTGISTVRVGMTGVGRLFFRLRIFRLPALRPSRAHGFISSRREARQRRARFGVEVFSIAHERLDDFQRRARFALGAPSLEVGGQLAVGANDLLIAHGLLGRACSAAARLFVVRHGREITTGCVRAGQALTET